MTAEDFAELAEDCMAILAETVSETEPQSPRWHGARVALTGLARDYPDLFVQWHDARPSYSHCSQC